MASIISAGTTSGTSLNLSGDTSGVLQLASNGTTTAVTIDTSQNVGIGTVSPATKLQVAGTTKIGVTGTNGVLQLARTSDGATITNFKTDGTSGIIDSAVDTIFQINTAEAMRIDSSSNLLFNSGYGSVAKAYGCRAWVNFNGTGTPAIRGSGNVSSITDNGEGRYAINFTTAMPDANYGANVSVSGQPGVSDANFITTDQNNTVRVSPTTSAFSMTAFRFQGTPIDPDFVRVSVFR